MHMSFTGSARKTRQINLSGRNTSNPWANLPGSAKSSQSTSSTHNAVAQAQAERVRRQQDRDRTNAAKKIQKTWRGFASRKIQKQKWRELWDAREAERLGLGQADGFDAGEYARYSNQPYSNEGLCLDQMRFLIRFFDFKREQDTARLLFFEGALQASFQQAESLKLDEIWRTTLRKLACVASRQIAHPSLQAVKQQATENQYIHLLGLITFITGVIPNDVALDANQHLHALQYLITVPGIGNTVLAGVAGCVITLLSHTTKARHLAFNALVKELLTKSQAQNVSPLLEFLRQPSQQIPLCEATKQYMQSGTILAVDNIVWLLSYMIYLRNNMPENNSEVVESFQIWLHVVSTLLSRCADEVAVCMDEVDQPMQGSESSKLRPFHPFVREQISTLAQQSNVLGIMNLLRKSEGSHESVLSVAKPLANYAIALLRAFPNKASNIRMWLYRGSPSTTDDPSTSTIRYLWHASERSGVFQKIRDQKNIMSVLVEAAPEHNQISRAQVSAAEIARWQEEWRIILLFMELYTFILKLMDDGEFFALDKRNSLNRLGGKYSTFQKGALPLNDVARMTTFLKNLAFTIYWNAADLDESNEIEETGGLAALFGAVPVQHPRPVVEKKPQTLAGNGVSQAYLKGLVTGLLRMLHERDSRRKFLPENHWLMTSQFDMQGFITDVVAEEEYRHEVGDNEEDMEETRGEIDEVDDHEIDDSDMIVPTLTTMFGIRPPHTPRTQTSRVTEQLRRRQEIARRKRQSQSLAPRLEILRNLPFFIPFETRVQIFREFVYRDQVRRRKGMIDPDQWRMFIAHSTQGRGLDGRPRGLDVVNRHHADIRRESVFQDAFENFYGLGEELKEPIHIGFIDKFGAAEAGIDGGGVTKEFLISVTSEAFDPNNSMQMFVENEQRVLYPNPSKFEAVAESLRRRGIIPGTEEFSNSVREILRQYEFLGRVVGKCLYEGILVDIVFAGFFLLKWSLTGGTTTATTETAYRASINDLRDFDESLYQGLLTLKNYTGDVESELGLNFTVTDEIKVQGRSYTVTKDLIPNGSNISVTNTNRLAYIDRITRYRLQQQPASVTNSFLKGLGQIIQPMWLAMFNQRELQKLVGGDNAELDIADLRRNTQYGGLYVIGDDGLEHPTVALFWKVLKDMNDEDRRKVLKFVTSTPRAPLLGFGHLNPRFSIRDSSEDQTRLPSTSTCVNLLKLPRYGDEKTMREKLLYAVNSGAGFDLS